MKVGELIELLSRTNPNQLVYIEIEGLEAAQFKTDNQAKAIFRGNPPVEEVQFEGFSENGALYLTIKPDRIQEA